MWNYPEINKEAMAKLQKYIDKRGTISAKDFRATRCEAELSEINEWSGKPNIPETGRLEFVIRPIQDYKQPAGIMTTNHIHFNIIYFKSCDPPLERLYLMDTNTFYNLITGKKLEFC